MPRNKTFSFNFNHEKKKRTFYLDIFCYSNSYNLNFDSIENKHYIYVYDEYKNLVKPFDLVFYYNIHIFCNLKLINEDSKVESFPNYCNNTNFICIENFYYYEKVDLGIKIYKNIKHSNKLISSYYYFSNNISNLMSANRNKDLKCCHYLIQNNNTDLFNGKNKTENKLTLKASYYKTPSHFTKTSRLNENNKWLFKNIYNQYFCFCKGLNCEKEKNNYDFQNCKYLFYLTVIDNNRNLFNKTDYLLADFIDSTWNDDDIFPIFKQMLDQNMSAHYMTLKKDIYNRYCLNNKRCLIIIRENFINGDFLEKYLKLILKLKVTVAGADFPSINHLFYNIEYITSINVGHGVKFFKSFLYKDYTSPQKYNKLVLAPSSKIIAVAKKYGWKDENIIKICLPKWDKYKNIASKNNKSNKSIFVFFTCREGNTKLVKKGNKITISKYYINNIILLLNNTELKKVLKENNITLYFGLHQNLIYLKDYIMKNFKFIKIIRNEMISDLLVKSSLIVTDFSSVLFDFIYQKKPVIIYIPDYDDPKIKELYSENYYNLIRSLGNGTIHFDNRFNNIQDLVNKIIFYVKSKFKLEKKTRYFYESFEFKCASNNIQLFIDYLKKINSD